MGFEKRCDSPELWEARKIINDARLALKKVNIGNSLYSMASTDEDRIYFSAEFRRQFCTGEEIDLVAARAYSEKVQGEIQIANGDARGQMTMFPQGESAGQERSVGSLVGRAYEVYHSIPF